MEKVAGNVMSAGTDQRESAGKQTKKPVFPELPKFPELPAPSTNAPWPEEEEKRLEDAIASCRKEPVYAYFVFRDVLGRKDWKGAGLSSQQREWLQNATKALRCPVESLFDRDYKMAVASEDARAALIAMEVLEKVRGEGKEKEPVETIIRVAEHYKEAVEILKRVVDGRGTSPSVWEISQLSESRMKTYSELFALQTLTITAAQGRELVRVTARVQNVSSQSDPVYVPCCLPEPVRYLFSVDRDEWGKMSGPRRFASQVFLFLKTPAGNIPCQFVCKDCETLRGGGVTRLLIELKGNSGAPFAGSFVEQGKVFDLDVLFSVPEGAKDLELVFLGSPPVRLRGAH
jgi:hypothetical protein